MQKQENFLSEAHRSEKDVLFWVQNIKVPFWIGHPPHLHMKPSLYVCRGVQGSQIFKQNWIILIGSRVIVILRFGFSRLWGVGQVGGGYWGWSAIVYMSSGMFRGKESLNRIKLSRLVQDLLNFAVLGSLRLWGGGRWVGECQGHLGAWGVSPHTRTYTRTHAHAHTHMYTCIEIANGRRHGGIHV